MKKNLILKCFTVSTLTVILISCKISPTEMKRNDVQFRSKPSAVKSVSVPAVMTTDDGVTVSWSYVDDATGYYLYYQTANEYLSDSTPRSVRLSKDDISYTFNNLNKAERYVFSVQSYKVVDNEELKGDMSVYKESATKPDLEVKQVLKDTNAILYFSTSERSSVLHTGKDIYDPEFVIYSNLDNDSEVISQALGTKAVTDSLKLYDTVKGVSLVEIPVKSNAEIQFSINMRVENTDLGNTKNELTVKTDPNLYPNPIKNITTTNGLKDRIEIEFEASPINDGVDGKQVFEIIRENKNTNQKTTVLSYTDEKNQPIQNLETKKYTFVDKKVTSNVQYTYTVQPYYVINNGKTYNTKSESAKSVNGAYSLPTFETLDGELKVVNEKEIGHKQYKIEHPESNKVEYTVKLLFTLPNYVKTDGLTYSLFRTNAANLNSIEDAQIGNEKDSTKNMYIVDNGELPESTENGNLLYFTLEDTVEITAEEDKIKNSFQYTIWLFKDKEVGQITTSSLVDTKPSIEEVDFVKTFTASDTSKNASNITLNFSLISDEELKAQVTSENLDLNKVKFILYRGDIVVNKEEIWTKNYSEVLLLNGLYNDDNDGKGLLNDHSYYYQLRAIYEDANSSYNNIYQFKQIESVKTLSDVKEFSASQGDSTKGITLTFTPIKEATSYAIYYKESSADDFVKAGEDILTINKDEGTALFTKDVNTANAGKKYSFRINAQDSNGKETLSSSLTAEGYLYGPYGFKLEATNFTSENIYKDRIELSWTEVPHTLRYEIDVYSEKNANVPLNTYQVKNTTSFSFKTTAVENDESISFPLSRPYYFRVRPLLSKDEIIDSTFLPIVEGSWILPPKNIVASKAESWNTVNVSWDNIGKSAMTYKVYRRVASSSEWSLISNVQNNEDSTISYSDFSANENVDYEYTVTSVVANRLIESEKQSRFISTDSKSYDNIGYRLSPPETVVITENDNEEYTVQVKPFKDIENFVIDMTDDNYGGKYIIRKEGDSFTTESTGVLSFDVKVSKNQYGIISVTFKRPSMLLVDSFSHKVNIKTLTEKENSTEVSASYELIHTPKKISNKEIVNFTNPILSELLKKADSAFDGDWWGNQQTFKGDGYNITSEGWKGLGWGADNSFITLTSYQDASSGIILTTNSSIKLLTKDEGAAGYLGTDPLEAIGKNKTGELKVTLPGNYGEATIVYDTVKVNGSSGTYTVTYNGITETFDYNQVHESKRALL